MRVSDPLKKLDRLDANSISRVRYGEDDVHQIRRRLKIIRQSASVLEAFFLAMTLNPDVYKKAQKEIDEKIGRDRLIEPSDRENLPYITCLLKEVLRCVRPTIGGPWTDPLFG